MQVSTNSDVLAMAQLKDWVIKKIQERPYLKDPSRFASMTDSRRGRAECKDRTQVAERFMAVYLDVNDEFTAIMNGFCANRGPESGRIHRDKIRKVLQGIQERERARYLGLGVGFEHEEMAA